MYSDKIRNFFKKMKSGGNFFQIFQNSEIVNKDVGMLCDYNNEKQIVNCIRRVLKKEFKKSSFVKLVNSHFSLKKISEKLDSAYTKVIR